jgi:hypothetical protein
VARQQKALLADKKNSGTVLAWFQRVQEPGTNQRLFFCRFRAVCHGSNFSRGCFLVVAVLHFTWFFRMRISHMRMLKFSSYEVKINFFKSSMETVIIF